MYQKNYNLITGYQKLLFSLLANYTSHGLGFHDYAKYIIQYELC